MVAGSVVTAGAEVPVGLGSRWGFWLGLDLGVGLGLALEGLELVNSIAESAMFLKGRPLRAGRARIARSIGAEPASAARTLQFAARMINPDGSRSLIFELLHDSGAEARIFLIGDRA